MTAPLAMVAVRGLGAEHDIDAPSGKVFLTLRPKHASIVLGQGTAMPTSVLRSPDKLSAQDVAQHILTLLPEDGTPVLNRVMRTMLSRAFQRPIEPELYFEARDILLKKNQIGRLRGQGGQLFLETVATAPKLVGDVRAEDELMEPLRRYLMGPFRKGLDLPNDGACIVQDTSRQLPSDVIITNITKEFET